MSAYMLYDIERDMWFASGCVYGWSNDISKSKRFANLDDAVNRLSLLLSGTRLLDEDDMKTIWCFCVNGEDIDFSAGFNFLEYYVEKANIRMY